MVAVEGKQGPTGNRQAGRQQEERVEWKGSQEMMKMCC